MPRDGARVVHGRRDRRLLNKHFVCIKVDREERPDIDEIYMTALQIYLQLVGSKQAGGWPLSMFLTPDAKPLMGGTYFPPRDKDGRMGFLTVLGPRARGLDRPTPKSGRKPATRWPITSPIACKQRPHAQGRQARTGAVDAVLAGLVGQYDENYGGFGFDPEPTRKQTQVSRAAEPGLLARPGRAHKSDDGQQRC